MLEKDNFKSFHEKTLEVLITLQQHEPLLVACKDSGLSTRLVNNGDRLYEALQDFLNSEEHESLEEAQRQLLNLTFSSLDCYLRAIMRDSHNEEAYRGAVEILSLVDEEKELALKLVNEGIRINPQSAGLLFFKGRILRELKEYGECLNSFMKSLNVLMNDNEFTSAPIIDLYDVIDEYAETLIETKNFQEAVELLNFFIREESQEPRLYFLRGRAYEAAGRNERAMKNYSKAIRLQERMARDDFENRPESYYAKARLLIAKEEFDKALKNLAIAIELDPRNSEYLLTRASIYHGIGNLKAALEDYESIEKIEGEDYKILIRKSEILEAMGNHGDSISVRIKAELVMRETLIATLSSDQKSGIVLEHPELISALTSYAKNNPDDFDSETINTSDFSHRVLDTRTNFRS